VAPFAETLRELLRARRARLGLAAVLLATAASLGLGLAAGPETVVVKRDDLVLRVDVEGELSAVRSIQIGPPPVADMDFKISFLAPEGMSVKKGEPILGFDTEGLERQRAERQAEYKEAVTKVEQKEIELNLKLLDIDQQAAQAEADFGKATLKVEVPADVQQRIELEKARLDQQGRDRDRQNLRAERIAAQILADAELASLKSERERARGRLAELEAAILRMTVQAPQGGIVVYETDWDDEKKKVGDSVWRAEQVLALPDLTEMRGDGSVDEADGGALVEGQRVTLRLEARPDLDLLGRVRRVGRTVRQKSRRSPGKVFKIDITLDKTDPTLMRPAMRFRGEVETARMSGVLLVPRDAVHLRATGPVAFARGWLGWREVAVRLGRGNRRQVEVLEGLREGDLVSLADLGGTAVETRASRPGSR
jgi:hypothetical protein